MTNSIKSLIALAVISLPLGLAAAENPLPRYEGIEASRIEVLVKKGEANGMVVAHGCKTCPVRATVDAQTRFFRYEEQITAEKAKSFAGEGGTLVYDIDTGVAHKVIW